MVEPVIRDFRDFASVTHGDHICLPYDDRDECSEVIVPFIADGLARGERCVYVVDDARRDELLRRLSDGGVNASRAIDRGALRTITPDQIYFRNGRGRFDPDETLDLVEALLADALADGFTGVRGSGEVTAPDPQDLRHDTSWPTMLAYEARFNERFARRPMVALCRYHRSEWPASVVADVLRTHRAAVVGGRVCRNPYYERPDLALATDHDDARVDWMLHQLRRSAANDLRVQEMTRSLADETARLTAEVRSRADAEDELSRAVRLRDHFLDDLSKELAGPIGGLAAELDGSSRTNNVGALRGHLKRLCAVIEELQEVSRITNRRHVACADEIDLCDVARQVALRSRDRLAALGSMVSFRAPETRVDAGVDAFVPVCVKGRWDRRRLEQLIANLLSNAGKRGAGQPIELAIGTEGGTASLSLRHHARPISSLDGHGDDRGCDDNELAAFQHGGRTSPDDPHSHLAGAGLWVAREIAGGFGGRLSVTTVAEQTIVTVELPRALPPRRRAPLA